MTGRVVLLLLALAPCALADDEDRDGLDDGFERELMLRFAPQFMVSAADCDSLPSEFQPGTPNPVAAARNGAIYYRVFKSRPAGGQGAFVEIHYFHLWSQDCGRMGHPLDVEHVSALVRAERFDQPPKAWKALYWFASAHEDTVCDASHGAKAAAILAQDRGPTVWISSGKHASFLSLRLCGRNCGGDVCEQMTPLTPSKFIHLGEEVALLNGAVWASSGQWKMAEKFRTDFGEDVIAQLEHPRSRIVSASDGSPPLQAVILAGGNTADAIALGNRHTGEALNTADERTGEALETAATSVENSLKQATRAVGGFLGVKPKTGNPKK